MKKEEEEPVLHFEPSAYLQRLIGRELISNEYIAVAELVKNAYDAGATEVTIELGREEPQRIVVSDNGLGMSLAEFERFWMMPGYSEKIGGSKAHERPLLGEKGIGRFAADKLAEKLIVVTKKARDNDALRVEFDWQDFEDRKKKMRDIPISYSRQTDNAFTRSSSGTRLELVGLRKTWDEKDWKKLRKELQNLVIPFRTVRDFRVFANAEGWESGQIRSPFETQDGYKYAISLTKGGRLTRTISRPKPIAKKLGKHAEKTERDKYPATFGPIKSVFYYVDRPGSLKRRGFEPGVGIYRDGFRVEPFGRENDDWLEVKLWKSKRHGHAPINPSRLFGYVEISRDDNPELKDVTNREGLLDTPQYLEFRSFMIKEFQRFAEFVEEDKRELEPESKAYVAQQTKEAQTVRQMTFAEIASQLAHQLRQPLEIIGLEAGTLEVWLQKKQLQDEEIAQATQIIKRSVETINDHITLMRKRAQCSRAPVVEFDLCRWIQDKIEGLKRQCSDRDIVMQLQGCQNESVVVYSREALAFVIDNFLQNALNAFTNVNDRDKEIRISIVQPKGGYHRILVQDNGNGLPLEYRDRVFRQSVPSRTGGTGFGLLYAQDIIKENNGDIGYENLEPFGSLFYVDFKDQETIDE